MWELLQCEICRRAGTATVRKSAQKLNVDGAAAHRQRKRKSDDATRGSRTDMEGSEDNTQTQGQQQMTRPVLGGTLDTPSAIILGLRTEVPEIDTIKKGVTTITASIAQTSHEAARGAAGWVYRR